MQEQQVDEELAALAAQLGIEDPKKLQALEALVEWVIRQVKQRLYQDLRLGR